MKGKTTLVLLVIAAALVSYLYLFEKKSLTTEEREARQGKIFSFEPEAVDRIQITSPAEDLVLEKQAGRWKITGPIQAVTDESAVSLLVSGLAGLKTTRRIVPGQEEDIDWGGYGLSEPAVRLRFRVAGDDRVRGFDLGKKAAFGGQLYARPLDEEILWILPAAMLGTFDKTSSDLRDRRILAIDGNAVTGIEIRYGETGKSGMVFSRDGEGRWLMEAPFRAKADEKAMETLLAGVSGMRARTFINEPERGLDGYGLEPPDIRVVFRTGETYQALDFGETAGGAAEDETYYCRLEGGKTIFTVGAEARDPFMQSPEDMQNRKITDFKTENVSAVTLIYPDQTIRCEKDDAGEWWLGAPGAGRCDNWTLDQYVSMTAALRTERFLALPPRGEKDFDLAPPRLTIELSVKGRQKPVILRLGRERPEGDGVYALSSQVPGLHVVETGIADNLAKSPFDIRLKEVFNFLLDDLALLEIETGGRKYRFEKKKGLWHMRSPREETLERDAMSNLTVKFSYLEMSGLPEKAPDLSGAGLSPPEMRIEIRLTGEEEKKVLLVGHRVETGGQGAQYYAMIAGTEEVFYLHPYVYEGLTASLKDLEAPASD
jgi:hypothetical protein